MPNLETGLRTLISRFDELASGAKEPPKIYIVGAGSLVLDGLVSRATRDLDFICDDAGERFENQVLPGGLHSHRVPSGLVSMPAGWRERSREAIEYGTKHARVFIPDIHDRLVDKVARGLATDWQDIAVVLESPPAGFSVRTLAKRAAALLEAPTSTVFSEETFRKAFDQLRRIAAKRGVEVPPPGAMDDENPPSRRM